MEATQVVELISKVVTILALLVGAGLAVFVFFQLAPVLTLRILSFWPVDESQWVLLRIEVENKSRVRVQKQSIHLQVLAYKIPEEGSLTEWVPFEQKAIIPTEKPIQWSEPIEIFRSTKTIDPNEVLVIERLHRCPPNTVLKVGLQVKAKLSLFGRIATQVRGWHQRWTTTRIVMKRQDGQEIAGNKRV